MRINEIFENSDDMFGAPRDELGKAISTGNWPKASGICLKREFRNPIVEKNIIPGIVKSEGFESTWYVVKDWYEKFISPAPWPELIQYVSALKTKVTVDAALTDLCYFYINASPDNASVVKQLILDKKEKAANAAVSFINHLGGIKQNPPRWPEMEQYIMTSPMAAMYYAASVLKRQWQEAEPYISRNKVAWSMYSARLLGTNNSTKAGRAARDAARQAALPDNLKLRISEDDDMFSNERPRQVAQRVVELMTSNHSIEDLENSPEPFRAAMYHLGYEDMDGTDWWDRVMDEINNLNESADDMFAPSARIQAQQAIKAVLDSNYSRYADLYNEIDPDQAGADDWLTRYGEFMSDYDYLRGELDRGGVKGFLNGLDMVANRVIDSIDGDLAIKHRVYLSDLENQYNPLDESEDDMFAPTKVTKENAAALLRGRSAYMANFAEAFRDDLGSYNKFQHEIRTINDLANTFDSRGLYAGAKAVRDLVNSSNYWKGAAWAHNIKELLMNAGIDVDKFKLDESDDDDMFAPSNRIVNPRVLANICHRLSVRYAKYAGTSEGDTQEMYINDSQALRRAANAFQSGVRAGLKELEDVEDSSTWEELADYAEREGIDIQELCDRYDAGELDESADDDMFAPSNKPDLRKISSAQLSTIYSLAKSDSRAEYASAHKSQMARIEAEMARRGTPIRSLAEQVNISIGSRKGK